MNFIEFSCCFVFNTLVSCTFHMARNRAHLKYKIVEAIDIIKVTWVTEQDICINTLQMELQMEKLKIVGQLI